MMSEAVAKGVPFPHAYLPDLIDAEAAEAILAWFQQEAPWRLRIASFYEQHEFSLLNDAPPEPLYFLTGSDFIGGLANQLRSIFREPSALELVDVAAHKLTPGQTIRIHNDYIGAEETHRVLIQFNSGWDTSNGGFLMIFRSDDPEDVEAVILPRHGSCFAFEISPASYHAVSRIHEGERYTLVYTFKRPSH